MPYFQRFAEFNESTYGSLVTSEVARFLRQQGDLTGVPITPTLRDEADLGYDVSINARWGMIYLQYKIAEYLRGVDAREYWKLNHPYFRFAVKTDVTSNWKVQHNTLCELEKKEAPRGGLVFYTAPIFLTMNELFTHLSNEAVADQSVFTSPLHLGPVAPDTLHRYTYTSAADVVPFSEPGPERNGSLGLVASSIREILPDTDPDSLSNYLSRTATLLREVSGLDSSQDSTAVEQVARITFALSLQPILVRYADRTTPAEDPRQPERLG